MDKEGLVKSVDADVMDVETEMPGQFAIARVDARVALAEFEAAAELHPKLVRLSIKMTKPQDWIEMGGHVYLQATGVERIATPWGLIFGEPKVVREDYPDGEFAYIVTGPVGSRKTGVYYRAVQGGRSSKDPFFDTFDEDRPKNWGDMPGPEKTAWKRQHRILPDAMDVRKAAYTNWQCRGASMVTGMRGLTAKDLEEQGHSGIKRVEFSSGGRGGDAVPADLKAEQVKLGNEVLKAAGGDKDAARQLMIDITSDGAFKGFDSASKLSKGKWQFDKARKKLAEHPVFGEKAQREPGEEE